MTDTTTLAPCPFCGGNQTAAPHDTHRPGCYFLVLASVKASPDADVSWATDLIAAWNRRAPAPASDALEKAVRKLHAAKGRHHNQIAACDLYDLLGLPNFRPGQEPVPPAQEAQLNPDMPTQELRLHMGELTTDEVLVARAAIRWANSQQEARVPLSDAKAALDALQKRSWTD